MKLELRNGEYYSDLNLRETMSYFSVIGCVYPKDEESYYVCSNVQEKLVSVNCEDGDFYGDAYSARKLCSEQEIE